MMTTPDLYLIAPKASSNGARVTRGIDIPDVRAGETFGIYETETAPLLETALARHGAANNLAERVTLIVADRPAPLEGRRLEPPTCSFIATAGIGRIIRGAGAPPEKWCYLAMRAALAGPRATTDIQVVHRNSPREPLGAAPGSVEAILCHKGPERFVRLCVDSLVRQTDPPHISLAFDQKYACPRLLDDVKGSDAIRLYQIHPHPIGPYVAFHVFGSQSEADFILRQDTDDLALPDRIRRLKAAAIQMDAGMVGSHDIDVNDIEQCVNPVRYPLDVNAALKTDVIDHQIMPRNAICTRAAFAAVGGYSTKRMFGHGVDFWIRAALTTRVVNLDEFLYIRRRHANSLLTRKDIGLGSDARKKNYASRAAALHAIRSAKAQIAETELGVRHRDAIVRFTDLRSGEEVSYDPHLVAPISRR